MPSGSPHDDVTQPLPAVHPHDTQELPAVGDAAPPPEPAPPSAPARPSPLAGPAPPHAGTPPPGVPAPSTAPIASSRRRPGPALLAALVLLGVTFGAVAGLLADGGSGDDAASGPSASASAAPTRVPARVSSVDPSGGSGFQPDGDGWRTQTYTTPEFGNLKPGVGLLLDLGRAQEITEITFDAGDSGATVGLRAADEPPASGTDLPPVGQDATATGRTTLSADGAGAHRYWLIWVSELGPRGDGYGATFGPPKVTAPAG